MYSVLLKVVIVVAVLRSCRTDGSYGNQGSRNFGQGNSALSPRSQFGGFNSRNRGGSSGSGYGSPQMNDIVRQSRFSDFSGGGSRRGFGGSGRSSFSGSFDSRSNSVSSHSGSQFGGGEQFEPAIRTVIRHPGGGIISGGSSGSSESSQNGYSQPKESSILRAGSFGRRGGRGSGSSGGIIHTRSFSQPRVERNQNNAAPNVNQGYGGSFQGQQSNFGGSNAGGFSNFESQQYSPLSDSGFGGISSGGFDEISQPSQQYGSPSVSQGYSAF